MERSTPSGRLIPYRGYVIEKPFLFFHFLGFGGGEVQGGMVQGRNGVERGEEVQGERERVQ